MHKIFKANQRYMQQLFFVFSNMLYLPIFVYILFIYLLAFFEKNTCYKAFQNYYIPVEDLHESYRCVSFFELIGYQIADSNGLQIIP